MQKNQVAEWFELWNNGLTLQQIADKFGVSREYARQVVSDHPDYNPSKRIDERNESIVYYHQNRPEFSNKRIAEIHGTSLRTVERACKGLKKAKRQP